MNSPERWKTTILVTLLVLVMVFAASLPGLAQTAQDLQEQIDQLKETVQQLEERVPKIGYINAQQVFTVFAEAVQQQRERSQQKQQEMLELRNKAARGEISESEFRRESDLLNAQILQAELTINTAMIEKMIESDGYVGIADQLRNLREQTAPIEEELEETIADIKAGTVSPDMVSEMLERINNQYQQLDRFLHNILESKIVAVTHQVGQNQGFDLIVREENVVLFQDQELITNLTETVREHLRQELN